MSKRLKTTQTLERFLSRVNHHMSPQISFTFEIAGWANWTGKWHVSTVFHNMDLKVATVQALVVAVWTNIHLASSPRLSGVYCDRLESWLSLRVVRECACLNHCIHLWNNILLTTEAQFNFASIQSLIQRLLAQASLIKLKPSKEIFFFPISLFISYFKKFSPLLRDFEHSQWLRRGSIPPVSQQQWKQNYDERLVGVMFFFFILA